MRPLVSLLFASLLSIAGFAQGPYAPAAGQPGSTAIHRDSSIIKTWASYCTVERGFIDISDPSQGVASFGTDADGVGYADGAVVSLGDSGVAIVEFPFPIYDGPGDDFAVFENSFSDNFLELAKVFVSSDGVNYVEFPSHSLIPDTAEIGGFGASDPTFLNNLAGKYRGQYGVPFDLQELADSSVVSIHHITHIMLIDVVGTIDTNYATLDTAKNKIVDPYPTPFNSGGFDLDGVGFLHEMLTSVEEREINKVVLFPNPAVNRIGIQGLNGSEVKNLGVYSSAGTLVKAFNVAEFNHELDLTGLSEGIYFLRIETQDATYTESFVKR